MRKVILASHGHLAEGMYSAVEMILGKREDVTYYDLDHQEEPDVILQLARREVEAAKGKEVVIFTDINNGSVHRQLMQLCVFSNVYVQSGMCLPMILEFLLCNAAMPLEEAIARALEAAKKSMQGFHYKMIKEEAEEELW